MGKINFYSEYALKNKNITQNGGVTNKIKYKFDKYTFVIHEDINKDSIAYNI